MSTNIRTSEELVKFTVGLQKSGNFSEIVASAIKTKKAMITEETDELYTAFLRSPTDDSLQAVIKTVKVLTEFTVPVESGWESWAQENMNKTVESNEPQSDPFEEGADEQPTPAADSLPTAPTAKTVSPADDGHDNEQTATPEGKVVPFAEHLLGIPLGVLLRMNLTEGSDDLAQLRAAQEALSLV